MKNIAVTQGLSGVSCASTSNSSVTRYNKAINPKLRKPVIYWSGKLGPVDIHLDAMMAPARCQFAA